MTRRRAWVARALIVVMAGVSLAPVLHAGTGHDTDGDPVMVVHDASQHRFSRTPADDGTLPADDHCVLCHLTRGSRGSAESTHSWAASAPEASGKARVAVHVRVAGPAAGPCPARAPPALA